MQTTSLSEFGGCLSEVLPARGPDRIGSEWTKKERIVSDVVTNQRVEKVRSR